MIYMIYDLYWFIDIDLWFISMIYLMIYHDFLNALIEIHVVSVLCRMVYAFSPIRLSYRLSNNRPNPKFAQFGSVKFGRTLKINQGSVHPPLFTVTPEEPISKTHFEDFPFSGDFAEPVVSFSFDTSAWGRENDKPVRHCSRSNCQKKQCSHLNAWHIGLQRIIVVIGVTTASSVLFRRRTARRRLIVLIVHSGFVIIEITEETRRERWKEKLETFLTFPWFLLQPNELYAQ